jgi:hypothetical protein
VGIVVKVFRTPLVLKVEALLKLLLRLLEEEGEEEDLAIRWQSSQVEEQAQHVFLLKRQC